MSQIPADFVNYKTTEIFERHSVPKMFLHLHNTRDGVYGNICVLEGKLKFTGYTERRGDVEQEVILNAGEKVVSPPQYWHKVEFLTEETKFKVEFYAYKDSDIVASNLSERN